MNKSCALVLEEEAEIGPAARDCVTQIAGSLRTKLKKSSYGVAWTQEQQ